LAAFFSFLCAVYLLPESQIPVVFPIVSDQPELAETLKLGKVSEHGYCSTPVRHFASAWQRSADRPRIRHVVNGAGRNELWKIFFVVKKLVEMSA